MHLLDFLSLDDADTSRHVVYESILRHLGPDHLLEILIPGNFISLSISRIFFLKNLWCSALSLAFSVLRSHIRLSRQKEDTETVQMINTIRTQLATFL